MNFSNRFNLRLRGMSFPGFEHNGADLRRVDATGANFSRARLMGANLADAILVDADLSGADLTGANLRGADLTNAKMGRAILRGADLRDTRGLTKRMLDSAVTDSKTKRPDSMLSSL